MIFLLRASLIIALLATAGVLFSSVSPLPASLAGDVGLDDVHVCEDLAQSAAVARLADSGFPRATTESVEIYRLVEVQDADVHVVQAQIVIDWANQKASCVDPNYLGPAHATFVLEPVAYDALVGELRHVIHTGELSRPSFGNWMALTFHADVDVYDNPDYDRAYKAKLAAWGAGRIFDGLV